MPGLSRSYSKGQEAQVKCSVVFSSAHTTVTLDRDPKDHSSVAF